MGAVSGRIHSMDAMRGALMMLGVVLHSAQVFNPSLPWVIQSDWTTPVAGWLVDAITLFRMPAFFIVAGFFCAVSLRRMRPEAFVVARMERIAVPLVVCALVLNSVQAWLLQTTGFVEFELGPYLAEGKWKSHLWFLVNLLVYLSGAYVVVRCAPRSARAWARAAAAELSRLPPLALIAAAAVLHYGGVKAAGQLGLMPADPLLGTFDMHSILGNAPYFGFGLLLAVRMDLLAAFTRVSPSLAAPALLASVALAGMLGDAASLSERIAGQAAAVVAAWLAAALCFGVFDRFFSRPSSLTRALADASYSVYLFHHLLVVAFGVLLVGAGLGGIVGFVVLTASVAGTALALHHYVIAPSSLGAYLFNGIRPAGKPRPIGVQVRFRRPAA